MYLLIPYLYILLITQTKQNMETFSTILLGSQFLLFVLVLSNMARLVSNFLISKIK